MHRHVLDDEISPLDLYLYLKARFGRPNGIQMALRSWSSENLVHWHYTLQAGPAILEIWEANLYLEMFAEGIDQPSADDWQAFVRAIKHDFQNYTADIGKVRNSLERWVLFINPYKRLREVADGCWTELKKLGLHKFQVPQTPRTAEDLKALNSLLREGTEKFARGVQLGVTIRMIAPVVAEAFVNLVVFLLAKPDIKADERLYQDVIRRQIDVRVRELHLTCDGFTRPVDTSGKAFRDFQTLMNRRNDFLHGNVDPKRLKYDAVYFDYRTVPIFLKRASFGELALSNRLIHIEPSACENDLSAVFGLIDLVLDSLSPERRKTLEMVMNTTAPGYREDIGLVGLLFPEHVIHSVPGERPNEKGI